MSATAINPLGFYAAAHAAVGVARRAEARVMQATRRVSPALGGGGSHGKGNSGESAAAGPAFLMPDPEPGAETETLGGPEPAAEIRRRYAAAPPIAAEDRAAEDHAAEDRAAEDRGAEPALDMLG